jgi:hypothetical protein
VENEKNSTGNIYDLAKDVFNGLKPNNNNMEKMLKPKPKNKDNDDYIEVAGTNG